MTRNLWTGMSLAASLCVTLAACDPGDVVSIPQSGNADLLGALDAGPGGVTIAVGARHKLTVTPRTVAGVPVTNLPLPTFTSSDSTKVAVDPDGTLRAKAVVSGAVVTAALTVDGVTKSADIFVNVTSQAERVATLKATQSFGLPLNPTLPLGGSAMLDYTATDSSGAPVTGLSVVFTSSDSRILDIMSYPGFSFASPSMLGKVKLIASTVSYGITLADTVDLTVLYATTGSVSFFGTTAAPSFSYGFGALAAGATVTFSNYNSGFGECNVTFENPSAVVGGDIESLAPFAMVTRTFPAAGTYKFRDTRSGATGEIIIRAQPTF